MNLKDIDKKIEELEDEARTKAEKDHILSLGKLYKGSDEMVSSVDYYALAQKEKTPFVAPSALRGLDMLLAGGFRPGNLILISGPTKQGKTTFCQTLTYNFYKQNYLSLWFSFDTPPVEIIERFPKTKTPIFFLPRRNEIDKKIEWIENKIIEGIAKNGIKVVFIDHLESLAGYSNNAPNYAAELQSIVRELKEISMRWNVVIFLNHHIRQIGAEEVPHYTHLKNSSGPAQEADTTIMIWRDRIKGTYGEITYANTGNVSVQLQRYVWGKLGTIKVLLDDNMFVEPSNVQATQQDDVF